MFHIKQAFAAKAVGISVGDVCFLFFSKSNATALTLAYIAHLTLKRCITSGAIFGFVLRHVTLSQNIKDNGNRLLLYEMELQR